MIQLKIQLIVPSVEVGEHFERKRVISMRKVLEMVPAGGWTVSGL